MIFKRRLKLSVETDSILNTSVWYIAIHHGRVVKRTGDGSLIEFRSVVDAVRCAIEVQNGMVERNAGLPPERRIEFRVGIHLGDVVEESDGDLRALVPSPKRSASPRETSTTTAVDSLKALDPQRPIREAANFGNAWRLLSDRLFPSKCSDRPKGDMRVSTD